MWSYYQTHETTDDAYVTGDIVPISARVSGTVMNVHASEHQQVEDGQLLAELDPDDFAARVVQAEAMVAGSGSTPAARRTASAIDTGQHQQ